MSGVIKGELTGNQDSDFKRLTNRNPFMASLLIGAESGATGNVTVKYILETGENLESVPDHRQRTLDETFPIDVSTFAGDSIYRSIELPVSAIKVVAQSVTGKITYDILEAGGPET